MQTEKPKLSREQRIALARLRADILRPKREEFYVDEKGNVIKKVSEDVEPIIEQAKAIRNNTDNGFSPERNLRHIGTIPLIILDQWIREGVDLRDSKAVKKRLNEFNKFRTVDKAL